MRTACVILRLHQKKSMIKDRRQEDSIQIALTSKCHIFLRYYIKHETISMCLTFQMNGATSA